MELNLAYYRDTHLHAESGQERVMQALIERVQVVRYLDPCLPRRMPYWLVCRLAPPLGEHRRSSFYEPASLPLEYAVMRHLLTAPGQVVHMLQGEPHYNYTAWLRHWPRRRGALVVTFHQPPERFEEVWRFRNKRARLKAIDHIVVTSTPQLDYFRELVGERVTKVLLGANRWAFGPPAAGRRERDEVRCIAVGSYLRDPKLLRRAIERVTARSDRVSFTVVSSREFLGELGTPPRTTALHALPDHALMDAYHDADVFVHPVAMAAGNTALLEAMSCGLATVAADVGGVRDYVDPGCAELVPPGDAAAMADAILRLARDGERRRHMGASAERRSRARDWPEMADELVAVYGKALARRR
jgi:glycosyltransferase involved in cell wall biosynthesis